MSPPGAAEPQPATAFPAAVAPSRWEWVLPSWPLIIGLIAFGRLLASRLALLNDPDTYLHIAAGRWILAHGALPAQDPFSHTMPGAGWQASEWLAEIILAAIYARFDWNGVILLAAACDAAAVAVLTHFLLRRLDPLPALIAAMAATALLLPHALARPHILALPLLVLWVGALLAARDDGRSPPYWLLPVMVLWANLHGSFMFGLAVAAFLAAEAVWQPGPGATRTAEAARWGGFVAAAIIAALVTPHGVFGLIQPFRLMQMPALQASFTEWMSPDFQKAPALEFWLLGLLAIGYAGVRPPLSRLVLLLGLVHMTLQHGRHADLLAVVAPLAISAAVGQRLRAAAGGTPSRLAVLLARSGRSASAPAIAGALVIAVVLAAPTASATIVRDNDPVTPSAALAAAERLGLTPGRVFNSEMYGGYLLFRGVPTFIDGRIEMYGNDFLAEVYRAESGDPTALEDLLGRYDIAWTLLTAHSGAAAIMDHLPGWERVYADQRAVIYRRSTASR